MESGLVVAAGVVVLASEVINDEGKVSVDHLVVKPLAARVTGGEAPLR